jgi:hypothetical protein
LGSALFCAAVPIGWHELLLAAFQSDVRSLLD